MAPDDPLEVVLHLEERFYQQGYQQGLADGAQAGRVEGRVVGLQKGFEKFLESGRLAAKAVVWANRRPPKPDPAGAAEASSEPPPPPPRCALPPLAGSARLDKNIRTLYALVEPDTLSTDNTDEAVQDFDDRLRRAQAKAKVVERMAG